MLNSNAFLNMHFGGHCAGFSLQLTLAEYKLLETSRSHTRRLLKVSSLVRLTKENHKCKRILWLWPPMDMCRVETNNTAMCFHIYIYILLLLGVNTHICTTVHGKSTNPTHLKTIVTVSTYIYICSYLQNHVDVLITGTMGASRN